MPVAAPTDLVEDVDVERRRGLSAVGAGLAAVGAEQHGRRRRGQRHHRLVTMVAALVGRGHWHLRVGRQATVLPETGSGWPAQAQTVSAKAGGQRTSGGHVKVWTSGARFGHFYVQSQGQC